MASENLKCGEAKSSHPRNWMWLSIYEKTFGKESHPQVGDEAKCHGIWKWIKTLSGSNRGKGEMKGTKIKKASPLSQPQWRSPSFQLLLESLRGKWGEAFQGHSVEGLACLVESKYIIPMWAGTEYVNKEMTWSGLYSSSCGKCLSN